MKFRLVVEFNSNTNLWSACFLERPGDIYVGTTKNEAKRNAKKALHMWLKTSSRSTSAEATGIRATATESMDDSTYLTSTAANRTALAQGLRDASEGNFIDIEL